MGYLYVSEGQLHYSFVDKDTFVNDEGVDDVDPVGHGDLYGFHVLFESESCKLHCCDFFASDAESLNELREKEDELVEYEDDYDDELMLQLGFSFNGQSYGWDFDSNEEKESVLELKLHSFNTKIRNLQAEIARFRIQKSKWDWGYEGLFSLKEELGFLKRERAVVRAQIRAQMRAERQSGIELKEKLEKRLDRMESSRVDTRRRWQRRPGRYLGDHNSGTTSYDGFVPKGFIPTEAVLPNGYRIRIS